MRLRLLLLLVLGFSISKINAQYVTIPDPVFRQYLIDSIPGCFNGAKQLDTTCVSLLNFPIIDNRSATYPPWDSVAKSLDGLQYLKGLKELYWIGDKTRQSVAYLPPLRNTLRAVVLMNNSLTSIGRLPDSLQTLNLSGNHIASLPAIPSNLLNLDISDDPLGSLPALPTTLRELLTGRTGVTSLSTLPDSLKVLSIDRTAISSLPQLPARLENLEISGTPLITCPQLPGGLKTLNVSRTAFTSLPALPATLVRLETDSTSLTNLPTLPSALMYLKASRTKISALPALPANLYTLVVDNNPFLSSLPALSIGLNRLDASNLPLLQSLPALPNYLSFLNCTNNPGITSMPALPLDIEAVNMANCFLRTLSPSINSINKGTVDINLSGNPLDSFLKTFVFTQNIGNLYLDSCNLTAFPQVQQPINLYVRNNPGITCLPLLHYNLISLNIKGTSVRCLPNWHPNFHYTIAADFPIDDSNPPLCTPTNNNYGCIAYPFIKGDVFYDLNNNGVKDLGEPARQGAPVSLSNLYSAYSNNAGYYEIVTDTTGTVVAKCTAPAYFKAVPDSIVVNLSTASVTQNFALQATVLKDSLSAEIMPYWAGRPGFSFVYTIRYTNEGSSNINNAFLRVTFDSSKLIYDSVSNPAITLTGNQLVFPIGSLPIGTAGSFVGYFTIKPTTHIGDSLLAAVTITGAAASYTSNAFSLISGSYDPNDKNATPRLTPEQINNGAYIDYIIRFQNTGNDTAIHVVVADTLSNDLQWNSFEMIGSSHTVKTTLKENRVFFEMRNIMLPDSNVNEPRSHGFVRFRIKPKTSVNVGADIPNKAAIYFDYNTPVITNTAITQIRNSVMPLRLLSFKGYRAGEADKLSWTTANEVNTKFFEVERLIDDRRFSNAGYVYAHGRGSGEYSYTVEKPAATSNFYRLRMVDLDGAFTYSNVVLIKGDTKGAFVLGANPVNDKLVLNVLSPSLVNSEARLINSAGMVVKRFVIKGTGNQTINLESLPAGVYYLQTVEGSEKVVK